GSIRFDGALDPLAARDHGAVRQPAAPAVQSGLSFYIQDARIVRRYCGAEIAGQGPVSYPDRQGVQDSEDSLRTSGRPSVLLRDLRAGGALVGTVVGGIHSVGQPAIRRGSLGPERLRAVCMRCWGGRRS